MFGASKKKRNNNTAEGNTERTELKHGADNDFYFDLRDSGDEELPFRESSLSATAPEPAQSEYDNKAAGEERELPISKPYRPHGREYSTKMKCIWFVSGAVFCVVIFAIFTWPLVLFARKTWGCTNSSWLEDLFEAIIPSGYLSYTWTFEITGITLVVYILLYILIAVRHVPGVLRVRSFIIDILTKLPCMLTFLPFASMFSILTMNKTSYLLQEERRRRAREEATSPSHFQLSIRARVSYSAKRNKNPSSYQPPQHTLQIQDDEDSGLTEFDIHDYPSSPTTNDASIASISNATNSSRRFITFKNDDDNIDNNAGDNRKSKSMEVELYPSGLFLLLWLATMIVPFIVLVTLAVTHMAHSDHLDIESFVSPLCVLIGCILSVGICGTGIYLRKSHLPYYFPVSFYPDWATIFGRGLWLMFGIIVWIVVFTGGLFPSSTKSYPLPNTAALNSTSIKFVTWNMGCSDLNAIVKEDFWEYRKKDFVKQLEYFKADVFALQDAYFIPLRYVRRQTLDVGNSSFRWYGKASRDGVHTGEHAAIFFRESRFQLLQSNTFWLSKTPLIPSTFSRNTAYKINNKEPQQKTDSANADIDPDDASQRAEIARNAYLNQRVCTWVRLKEIASGQQFIVATTHYGVGDDSYDIRATRLILSRLNRASHGGKLPVILMGDFNGTSSQKWYEEITNSSEGASLGFLDSMKVCDGIICIPLNCTEPLEWTSEPKCNLTE